MGNSFFRKVTVLGALTLLPGVAYADSAVDQANRAIVNAQTNTKRALRDTGDKLNDDIVNAREKTKRAIKGTDNKVNNDLVDTQHKVKRTAKDTADKTNNR
jgi:gas vesicle protein